MLKFGLILVLLITLILTKLFFFNCGVLDSVVQKRCN